MADLTPEQRAEIIAELQRRGVAIPGQTAAPAAPAAAGADAPTVPQTQDSPTPPADAPAPEGAPAAAPAAQPGFFERAYNDIKNGIPELPAAIGRGVAGAAQETAHLMGEAADFVHDPFGTAPKNMPSVVAQGAKGVEWLSQQLHDALPAPQTTTGNFAEGAAQFTAGMIGFGKFLKIGEGVSLASKVGTSLLQNGGVSAVVFDGAGQRLSDMLEQNPTLAPYVPAFLQSKPGDTDIEGRIKNAIEGMVVGPAADALMWSLKGFRAMLQGDKAGALKATEEAAKAQEKAKAEGESATAPAEQPTDPNAAPVDPANPSPANADTTTQATPQDATATTQAATEGIPQDQSVQGPKDEHLTAAPYAEDLAAKDGSAVPPMPKFSLRDVLPKISNGLKQDAVTAVQQRFSLDPEGTGLKPISPDQRFNMDHIDGPDTLKAAIDQLTQVGAKAIDTARGSEVVTHQKTAAMATDFADTVGVRPADLLAVMGHDAATLKDLHARLLAYRTFRDDAAWQASDLADKALAMEGSSQGTELQAKALHAANIAMQVNAMVKGQETGIARALSAQRIASKAAKRMAGWDYEALAQQLDKGQYHGDDKTLLLYLKGLKDNPKGFSKLMEQSLGGRIKDAISSWGMNAMLSSPKTWVANLLSNVGMVTYGPIERAVAGMIGGASHPWVAMKDEYVGMGLSLLDSMKVAGTAMKNNVSILDPKNGGKLGPNGAAIDGLSARGLGITRDIYSPSGELIRTETTPVLSSLMDGVSTMVNIPSRMLTGGDELTKQVIYRGFLYSRAAQAARIQGLTGDAFNKFVAERMDQGFADGGNLKAVGSATDKAGLQEARWGTFTQDLEYGISRWIQGMSNESIMARMVVPFVRTPVNIFRFTWQHTPGIARFQEGVRRDYAAGGMAKARAQAAQVTGAAMWSLAGFLAYNGVITGSSPIDPQLRQAKEATGWKEYSLHIGDKYYSFNRMDPMGQILGLAADFTDLTSHLSQNQLDKIGTGMVLALGKNLMSKTYLQGVTNMFKAIGDVMAGRGEQGLESFAYQTLGSWTVPSIVSNVRGESDDLLREVRSVVDAEKSRIPGYSKQLPPVRNMLGEAVEAPKGWGPDMISPIGLTQDKHDPVYDELARQMLVANHPLGRAEPHLPGVDIDLREVQTDKGQNAYDRMQEILSQSGVKQRLAKLFASPAYQKRPDGSLDYPAAEGTKLSMTNEILTNYREFARQKLLAENPVLYKHYQQELKHAQLTGTGRPDTGVHYQPPGFLDSLFGDGKRFK